MKLYYSNKSTLIRVICRTNQWSGLKESNLTDWLQGNFKDPEGKYLAVKILLHSLYYSEENLIELLRHGIYHEIIGEEIKSNLIASNNIFVPQSVTEAEVRQKVDKILFVPLLDKNRPNESGNAIIRYLTTKLSISPSNTIFHFNIKDSDLDNIEKIIIVDDCIGSGDQLNTFWNTTFLDVKNKALAKGVDIYYLALIGYENQVLDLQLTGDLVGLRVVICDKLEERNKIYSSQNIIWNSDEEMNFAITYFDDIGSKYGVPRVGYAGLDFSLFMHNSVPDWTLPIFWTENYDWKPLLKRKNSNS
ncbi:phosphoribosyltransferase-like protein [Panacibacter ginsenosidivorans]|nr:hypothetical protein [Panacibacter ginsenosidivorans]